MIAQLSDMAAGANGDGQRGNVSGYCSVSLRLPRPARKPAGALFGAGLEGRAMKCPKLYFVHSLSATPGLNGH